MNMASAIMWGGVIPNSEHLFHYGLAYSTAEWAADVLPVMITAMDEIMRPLFLEALKKHYDRPEREMLQANPDWQYVVVR